MALMNYIQTNLDYQCEKLYENGSPQIDPILELFRGYNLENYRNWLGISKNVSNYSELARSFTESSDKNSPHYNMEG